MAFGADPCGTVLTVSIGLDVIEAYGSIDRHHVFFASKQTHRKI